MFLCLRCLSPESWWHWWVRYVTVRNQIRVIAAESSIASDSRSASFFNEELFFPNTVFISFSFLQVPMPSYLIAIVVGALESRWSSSAVFSVLISEPCSYFHMTDHIYIFSTHHSVVAVFYIHIGWPIRRSHLYMERYSSKHSLF